MKKKHSFFDFIEFSLIFFTFVLPSLLVGYNSTVNLSIQPPLFFILIRICVLMYICLRMHDTGMLLHSNTSLSLTTLFKYLKKGIFVCLILFFIGILFNVFSYLSAHSTPQIIAEPPKNFFTWSWFIFSITSLACFEEVIFRLYLPEKFFYYLKVSSSYQSVSHKHAIAFRIILELPFIVLFAIGHRYLGFLAVFSALVSGATLRFFVHKYNSIIPGCIAHAINNIVSFIVVFYVV